MTTISDPHTAPQTASGEPGAASDRMPRAARWGLGVALTGLMGSALYLAVVRGEALLVDLAALGSRLWCF